MEISKGIFIAGITLIALGIFSGKDSLTIIGIATAFVGGAIAKLANR